VSPTLAFADLAAPVAAEMARVGRELVSELFDQQQELRPLLEHVARYRGKQLRPMLVLLSGRAVGALREEHLTVAKIVELLHTATLVHDDILDGAELRRRLPTVSHLHGNEISVLLGDFLYAHAFHLAVSLPDPTCSRLLSEVVRTICRGEITQILHRFDFDWSEARYFEVIADKTASLYAAACELGAYYAGASRDDRERFARYGSAIGVAFQIVDDCLDLEGDEQVVGKTLGSDLEKGKLTLPLLYLLHGPGGDRLPGLMIGPAGGPRLARLRAEFDLAGAVAQARAEAARRVDRALTELDALPESAARAALAQVGQHVLRRSL
jgi:octaprenyl-diphosphate synthase